MEALNLINPEFDFEFNGTTYRVKKATLEKIILFQTRFNKLTDEKDPAIEPKMAAYCLYLILCGVKQGLTEEEVQQNIPDVSMVDVVERFGFMNRQKVEILRKVLQKGMGVEDKQDAPVQEKGAPSGASSST